MQRLVSLLAQKTQLKPEHIKNILKLLDEGATIPFIARYRKEMSGGAAYFTLFFHPFHSQPSTFLSPKQAYEIVS